MPFILIGSGIILVLTGIQGDASQLYGLVVKDFTGKNNYLYWMLSILVLGTLGYYTKLQPFSRAFMALVIIVLFLSNEGFFTKFQNQFFPSSSSTGV